jgi:predicted nucleotidyltransferase
LESLDRTGIIAVLVYGSALGRHFRSDSDLDIAVLDRSENPASEATLARMMDAIERRTGREVDLRRIADLSLSHQAHVIEQGRPVWIGDPQALEVARREVLRQNAEQRPISGRAWPALLERLRRDHAA